MFKANSRKLLMVLLFGILAMASFNIAIAFLQTPTEVSITSLSMPWQLWAPFFLGFIGHWYANYTKDKVTVNFFVYFSTGVLNSIAAVVGGFVSFAGMYSGNPDGYPNNFFGWASVFLISYAWDSLANGMSNSWKTAPPVDK